SWFPSGVGSPSFSSGGEGEPQPPPEPRRELALRSAPPRTEGHLDPVGGAPVALTLADDRLVHEVDLEPRPEVLLRPPKADGLRPPHRVRDDAHEKIMRHRRPPCWPTQTVGRTPDVRKHHAAEAPPSRRSRSPRRTPRPPQAPSRRRNGRRSGSAAPASCGCGGSSRPRSTSSPARAPSARTPPGSHPARWS